jgi:hypothetical protein
METVADSILKFLAPKFLYGTIPVQLSPVILSLLMAAGQGAGGKGSLMVASLIRQLMLCNHPSVQLSSSYQCPFLIEGRKGSE